MNKDSIGNRMKTNYEHRQRFYLTRRTPVIIRLDGKAFHTLTRHCEKPFDDHFTQSMDQTAFYLCKNIQGAKVAYVQSDEISILLTDFDKLTTEAWFDYNLQKVTSISAAMASVYFSSIFSCTHMALFDSRAFNIPKEEVSNYFVWRQQDWVRNSLQMLAQSHFSHKQLHNKNQADMHEMLHEKGINWAGLPNRYKNGCFLFQVVGQWIKLKNYIVTQDRTKIENLLIPNEE